jgi:hypothetical protein
VTTDLDMILAELDPADIDSMRAELISEGWTDADLDGIDFTRTVAEATAHYRAGDELSTWINAIAS